MARFLLIVVAFLVTTMSAFAQLADSPRELTKPEQTVVRICKELQADYEEHYAQGEKITDDTERSKFYDEKDPLARYVPALVELEREHHGTDAGLMVIRQLMLPGVRGGRVDNIRDVTRRQALAVLPDYANAAVLPEILRYLDSGNFEPATETALRQVIRAKDASDQNRLFARYMLASWSLKSRDGKEFKQRRLKEIDAGSPLWFPMEREYLSEGLGRAFSDEKLAELQREAVETLEAVTKSDSAVRRPAITGVDQDAFIIRVDVEKTKSMPLIKDLAAGVLFKEQHLRIGKPAPDLNVELVSGRKWSLAEQRGKTVVIQFSFKGCGPCEEMYPDLRALADEYKGKLTILGVMADDKREDTTEAVDSGKLTWDVSWDGFRGPIATKWAVTSFPTVYLIGPDGRVAAFGLRGEQLRAKVAELTR